VPYNEKDSPSRCEDIRIYLQEPRRIVMGRAYIIQSMIITIERKGKSMRGFNDTRQMQQIMEMKMRERMVEMERRGQGMRKRDSNPRLPVPLKITG
jgi:hypothetical protein